MVVGYRHTHKHMTGFPYVCKVQSTVHIRLIRIHAPSLLLVCNSCNWILFDTDSHKVDRITGLLYQPEGSALIWTTIVTDKRE